MQVQKHQIQAVIFSPKDTENSRNVIRHNLFLIYPN